MGREMRPRQTALGRGRGGRKQASGVCPATEGRDVWLAWVGQGWEGVRRGWEVQEMSV